MLNYASITEELSVVNRKSNIYELCMMGLNGGWSGIIMSYWQSEDCGRVLKWAFTHLHLLLPGLSCHSFPCPEFFLAWSCPREVQGQLLNGKKRKLKKWRKSFSMSYPAKRMNSVLEKEVQKKKIEEMPYLSFGVQAALVLFILPFHNGTGSLKCFYYSRKCWAWTWETCGTMKVLQSRSCECWHQVKWVAKACHE